MIREDGSILSSNNPTARNRYQIKDYGLYRGVVRDTIYIDDDRNDTNGGVDCTEVVYTIMVVGGDRDGQIFNNARLMRTLGGFDNFEEITLKQTEGITGFDISAVGALADPSIRNIEKLSGDNVYIQFLNGDLHMPVIVGLAKHGADSIAEAEESEGPRMRKRFNGIYTEINLDGEFTWSKDNGAWVPFLPNINNPLAPFVNQFAPLPGQDEAVKITLGNKYDFLFEYSLGLSVSIDGIADAFEFTTTTGTALTITGLATDTIEATTALGTKVSIAGGTSDSIEMATAVGAAIKIDGLGDEISLSTTAGSALTLSASSGVSIESFEGTSLELATGAATLKNPAGAQLVLDTAGTIKLGNATGDAMQLIGQLIQSLAGAVYSGFGAPGSNVADLAQLVVKWKLISG